MLSPYARPEAWLANVIVSCAIKVIVCTTSTALGAVAVIVMVVLVAFSLI
jgi:hypothetical protein